MNVTKGFAKNKALKLRLQAARFSQKIHVPQRPFLTQRRDDFKRLILIIKFDFPRMKEHLRCRLPAVERIAQNRIAQAFHGNMKLVGFARMRIQDKQAQTGF